MNDTDTNSPVPIIPPSNSAPIPQPTPQPPRTEPNRMIAPAAPGVVKGDERPIFINLPPTPSKPSLPSTPAPQPPITSSDE